MVQIDINMKNIAKKYPVEVGLLGNSAILIPKLTDESPREKEPCLPQRNFPPKRRLAQATMRKKQTRRLSRLRAPYIMKVLNEKVASDAVFSLDVGENCWWFGRNFQMKKTQKMVMSGLLASMGFGLPGALAAALAYPDRQIVCITGDGGFTQVMGDFVTALKYQLPSQNLHHEQQAPGHDYAGAESRRLQKQPNGTVTTTTSRTSQSTQAAWA